MGEKRKKKVGLLAPLDKSISSSGTPIKRDPHQNPLRVAHPRP